MASMLMIDSSPVEVIDLAALAWFFVLTVGYDLYAESGRYRERRSLHSAMNKFRYQWMKQMLRREQRIADAAIVANLLRSIIFFATTSIFIVGGLVGMLGSREKAVDALTTLPFTAQTTGVMWEVKIILLLLIFTYAFFKYTWSMRTHNYTSIMVGAAPMPNEHPERHEEFAQKAAALARNAARHFNQGMRAYYYGLAALTWFLHPVVFMVITFWVVAVIYRREFHSNSMATLLGETLS